MGLLLLCFHSQATLCGGKWSGNEAPTDLVAVGNEERSEQSAVEGHSLHTSVCDILGREKHVLSQSPYVCKFLMLAVLSKPGR